MPTAADAPFIAAIENDVELKRLAGGPSGESEERYRRSLAAPRDLRCLVVESLATGFPIGRCGLITGVFSHDCEVHVLLTKDHSGRGIGTEIAIALQQLAVEFFSSRAVTAKLHPDNAPSLAIVAKLGLEADGTVRSESYDNGWLKFRAPVIT